ncbi:hypothetical protein CAPTEDRAFT_64072, partial [Capitella teleta]
LYFLVKSCKDVHIMLSGSIGDIQNAYEIEIGGNTNQITDIRFGSMGNILVQVDTPFICNCDEYQPFWVSWEDKKIEVGTGEKRLHPYISYTEEEGEELEIAALTLSTYINSPGAFILPQRYCQSLCPTRACDLTLIYSHSNATSSVILQVKACQNAYLALARSIDTVAHAYEIVIGGWENQRSVIRATPHGEIEVEVETVGILSCEEHRTFWASWQDGHVQVGEGAIVGDRRFMGWLNPNKAWDVTAVGVSSGYEAEADW